MRRLNRVGITSCGYLGVLLTSGPRFNCRFNDAKAKFYRTFKAIMGKVGRITLQEVTLTLVQSKCLLTLLYCLEVCPLNTKDTKSLEYPITCALSKIFQTNSYELKNANVLSVLTLVRHCNCAKSSPSCNVIPVLVILYAKKIW